MSAPSPVTVPAAISPQALYRRRRSFLLGRRGVEEIMDEGSVSGISFKNRTRAQCQHLRSVVTRFTTFPSPSASAAVAVYARAVPATPAQKPALTYFPSPDSYSSDPMDTSEGSMAQRQEKRRQRQMNKDSKDLENLRRKMEAWEKKGDYKCVVCEKSRSARYVLPCAHRTLCLDCSQVVRSCPLCRTPITGSTPNANEAMQARKVHQNLISDSVIDDGESSVNSSNGPIVPDVSDTSQQEIPRNTSVQFRLEDRGGRSSCNFMHWTHPRHPRPFSFFGVGVVCAGGDGDRVTAVRWLKSRGKRCHVQENGEADVLALGYQSGRVIIATVQYVYKSTTDADAVPILKVEDIKLIILENFKGHSGPVFDICWSDSCETMISASADSTLHIWDSGVSLTDSSYDLSSRPCKLSRTSQCSSPVTNCVFLHGRNDLIVCGQVDGFVNIYNVNSLQRMTHLRISTCVSALALSPDNAMLFLGDIQGNLYLFGGLPQDQSTISAHFSMQLLFKQLMVVEDKKRNRPPHKITGLSFSNIAIVHKNVEREGVVPVGTVLVNVNDNNARLCSVYSSTLGVLIDMEKPVKRRQSIGPLQRLKKETSLLFKKSSSSVASHASPPMDDNRASQPIRLPILHQSDNLRGAFCPHPIHKLALGSEDSEILIFDFATYGAHVCNKLFGHRSAVVSLDWSSDASSFSAGVRETLVSIDSSGACLVWFREDSRPSAPASPSPQSPHSPLSPSSPGALGVALSPLALSRFF